MKTRARLVLVILSLFVIVPYLGNAQCGTIHTLSYDSTVIGTGGSDTPYELSFPAFNSSLGTLLDVKIVSILTIVFQYDIENNGPAKTNKLKINRDDEITSSALSDVVYHSYSIPKPPTTINHSLGANDGVTGSGPDFLSVAPYALVNHDTVINQSADNPANFLGSGDVSFNYSSSTALILSPLGGANISNTAATDQIKFVLQYIYCDNIMLAPNITSFSASPKDGFIDLRWLTANELPGQTYQVQKSNDGTHFTTVTSLSSQPGMTQTGNYDYHYISSANETGKLYFRIVQINAAGTPAYSPVRMADRSMAARPKSDIKLVPNPSRGRFAIVVDNTVASDWAIELFNIKGQVVARRQAYNSTLSNFEISESLSAGVYFVMVTDKRNSRKFVERLIVN